MRKRNILFRVYLNEVEKKRLDNLSQAAGRTQSGLVRNMLMGYQLCEKPDKEFYQSLQALNRLNANMNQIRLRLHTDGIAYEDVVMDACTELQVFIKELREKYLLPKETNEVQAVIPEKWKGK